MKHAIRSTYVRVHLPCVRGETEGLSRSKVPRLVDRGGRSIFRFRRNHQTSSTATMTARTNARNGHEVRSARYPAATTVTVHSREATSEPSDTVTFTVCGPSVVDAKFSPLVFPPVTTPSTRQVYVSASPSGSHAMTANICVDPASTVLGPSPGLLEVIWGARSRTVTVRIVWSERPRLSTTVSRTPKLPFTA